MLNFSRRINRQTYLVGVLLSLVLFILGVLMVGATTPSDAEEPSDAAIWFFAIVTLLMVLYNICLVRQRSNDFNGEHALLITVLFIFSGLSFLLFFLPGEKKANKYGKVPKGIQLN